MQQPVFSLRERIRNKRNAALFRLGLMGHLRACAQLCARELRGQQGLEIGGPSRLMFTDRGALPIYPFVRQLDNCNFSDSTMWEGTLREGANFEFHPSRSPGWQYIREATDLQGIPDARYDFLISSHVIEHVANPLRALREWMRVIRPGGLLVMVVPHKDGTFDHRRPITTLAHLIEDFERDTPEDDLSHLPEILRLHDHKRSPLRETPEEWEARCRRNAQVRGMHHHVFNTPLVVEMMHHAGLEMLVAEAAWPCHIAAIGRKTVRVERASAAPLGIIRRSHFKSDCIRRAA